MADHYAPTKRLAQLYLVCLFFLFIGMLVNGCGSRRCTSCEGPYTVYHRQPACGYTPYASCRHVNTCVNPQSRYWNDGQITANPRYSSGWYYSTTPYGRNSRHLHFGCNNY